MNIDMNYVWLALGLVFLQGCNSGADPTSACGKDADCKGDRICEQGVCVAPQAAATAVAASSDSESGIPVCIEGDGKTRIPVWRPSFDDKGMDSEPPQGEGRIVYIDFHSSKVDMNQCFGDENKSFSVPDRGEDSWGGLEVNIHGNTQYANGGCYFRGYYLNEPVMGMHQGWLSTLFKPLDVKELVLAGRYCRER